MENIENIIEYKRMLEDLRIWAGCGVCIHCDIDTYPCKGYCKLGGCFGGDKWEYRSFKK